MRAINAGWRIVIADSYRCKIKIQVSGYRLRVASYDER